MVTRTLSYESYYPSYLSNYEDSECKNQREGKTSYSNGDAISDEDFAKAQQLAEASPLMKKREPDQIENITVQVFTHLCAFTDRDQRKEVEAAVLEVNEDSKENSKSSISKFKAKYSFSKIKEAFHQARDKINELPYFQSQFKSNYSHQFRPFQDDDLFEEELREEGIPTRNIIRSSLSVLAYLFLGWERFDAKEDDENQKKIEKDHKVWQERLKPHYSDVFQGEMDLIFAQAEGVSKNRQEQARSVYLQRLTFYAMLIISAIGKLISHRTVMILGLTAASITSIVMIALYGVNSFKQGQLEANLKTSILNAYNMAGTCRRSLPHQPLLMGNY